MHAVHPVFHVSQLEPAIPNTIPDRIQPPPLPVEVDGEPEFEIAEILDSQVDHRRKSCKLLYLVHWSSYEGTDKETSWLLATELGNTMELLEDYHVRYLDHSRPCSITLTSVSFIYFPHLFSLSVFLCNITHSQIKATFLINKK